MASLLYTTKLGLVCLTAGEEVRYRTITRARFLTLSQQTQYESLKELYADNLQRLFKALDFCVANRIQLYRMLCGLFPLNDEPTGEIVLKEFAEACAKFGPRARTLGIRVLMHPDQFVVLNSERPHVIQQSIHILSRHALIFDMLGMPQSTWAPMILHGGKSGRAKELVQVIADLPENIRARLVLENDESAYSASAILEICRESKVPMVFDPHHHAVRENLASYEHPGLARFVEAARSTWPEPSWQLAHVSNGAARFNDPRHSDCITLFPSALRQVPWVEVEAKGKEVAIRKLRELFPELQ